MPDPDGDPLLRTDYQGYSPDGVMELTTRLRVFAQPPRHRYCPVTVPDERIRSARSQASARRGGRLSEGGLGMVAGSGCRNGTKRDSCAHACEE